MELKTFEDFFDITSSKRVFKSEWKNEGVPFYRAREIVKISKYGFVDNELFISDEMYNNYKEKYGVPQEGDILVTAVGTLGVCYNVKKTDRFYFKDGNIIWFKKRKEINTKYVEYLFKSDEIIKQVNSHVGAVVGTFTIEKAKKTKIPVPSFVDQQQIVEKLDTAFDLIDRAKSNIEQNIQNAKELFQSKLNQVFSEKGEGWEEVKLAKVCTMKRGHNPPKSKFIYEPKEGYVRFYQIRDGSSEKNAVYVPDTPQLQRVEPDDILMVAYRHVGRAFRGVSGCFNVALCKISNNDQSILDNDFLFYLIPSDVIRGELLKHSERSLIPSMSVEHLKKLAIPLPPINEQKVIVELLNIFRDSTDGLIYKYQQKLNNLEEMKKSILEKAFKGELI